jgi:hypothetical protein
MGFNIKINLIHKIRILNLDVPTNERILHKPQFLNQSKKYHQLGLFESLHKYLPSLQ